MKKLFHIFIILILIVSSAAGCDNQDTEEPVSMIGSPSADQSPAVPAPDEAATEEPGEGGQRPGGGASGEEPPDDQDAEIRALLEKGSVIDNFSYTGRFISDDNEYVFEYYKRGSLTKTITYDGETVSVSIGDGQSTVYYSLPDKVGFMMTEAGDDMGLIPSTEALLNETVYSFLSMGQEIVSGDQCLVVETEDEFGALKIWISETLGLPVKIIGTDDNGWYNLELTDILLEEPPESVFVIPDDVQMTY